MPGMTPATMVVTIVLCIALLSLQRRAVIPIFVIGMCFVPADQALIIAGLDFKVLRLLALAGGLRLLVRPNEYTFKTEKYDVWFFAWIMASTIIFVVLWGTAQSFIYRMGGLVDSAFIYIIFKCYFRSADDIESLFRWLVYCTIILTPFVIIEHTQNTNPFHIFGRDLTSLRDGRIRCSAAFSHAILLGSFSASIAPLALAQWQMANSPKSKTLFAFGFGCAIYITIASASSGPIIAMAGGIFAYLMMTYRKYLGKATMLLVLVLIGLHFAMKAPVWHLISRIDVAGGSTGYHRFKLIDETINHFSEWALTGVRGVAHWGIHAGDVTSMYIAQAVGGGFLTFVLFIVLMTKTLRTYWLVSLSAKDAHLRYLAWACFAFMFSHAVSFISVAYFGQIYMLLILTFSLASVMRSKQFWRRHRALASRPRIQINSLERRT